MSVIKSFCSAFLMYSRIPMPPVEWKEENRRFSLCFFPLIGAVIGGLLIIWFWVCRRFGVGSMLFSAVSAAIPILITGGIHLDGFCDVCDAKASFGSREKMLEIMSDSRIGAFAAIDLAVYLMLQIGFFAEIKSFRTLMIIALGFVMSRAWSGLAAVTFPCAKKNGTLQSFSKTAYRKLTIGAEIFYITLTSAIMIYLNLKCGTAAILGGAVSIIYYKRFSVKKFGGITGDLAGWFLQICELSILGFAVIAEVIF